MAAKYLIENLKAELTCSICLGYFTNPVAAKCGHSFCKECLLQCMEGGDATLTCPECRAIIKKKDLILNLALWHLSISGKKLRPHLLQSMEKVTTCDQHGEKENLFCEDDQKLLCESCSLAPEHKDHQVVPLNRAIDKYQSKFEETRNFLCEMEEEYKIALGIVNRREEYCKEDTYAFKQSVRSEYRKMYQFLRNEEKKHLQLLDNQSQKHMANLGENRAQFLQELQNLQRKISEMDETLDKTPTEMIQDIKSLLKSNKKMLLQKPEIATLNWNTCPITGLKNMLMSYHRDITLDSETANPLLILSEDLKHVKFGSVSQHVPDNEEEFIDVFSVMGVQTFTSGQHYWEVELGDNTNWEVGVCHDPLNRKGNLSILPEYIYSLEGFKSGNGFFFWKSEKRYYVSEPVNKVGIFLDYEKGHIAFYNIIEEYLLYSLPSISFPGPLRPYFFLCNHKEEGTPASLNICSSSI